MKIVRIGSLLMTAVLLVYLLLIPDEVEALTKAKKEMQHGNYTGAIDILQEYEVDPLILGNTYYKAGATQTKETSTSEDVGNNPQELYVKAVEIYEVGIVENPQRVDLKYNYEFVKRMLEDQQQDQENQQNDEEQNGNKDQEQDQDNKEDQGQDQEQNKDNQEEQSDNQENNKEQSDNQKQDQQKSDGQSDTQPKEDQNGNEENDEQESIESDSNDQGVNNQNTDANDNKGIDEQMISQVLKMLAEQEKDSLKNNQQVIDNKEEGGKNDW